MKFKEATIHVWISFLEEFGEEWKFYLPEAIDKNYETNIGKDIDDMEIKAFDTKWFIGVRNSFLLSINFLLVSSIN